MEQEADNDKGSEEDELSNQAANDNVLVSLDR